MADTPNLNSQLYTLHSKQRTFCARKKEKIIMTLQEFYPLVGGDYAATLGRLPSEALVKKFLLKYPADPS